MVGYTALEAGYVDGYSEAHGAGSGVTVGQSDPVLGSQRREPLIHPQVRKKNSLKDCVAVAGPLGVTHFLILSKTETAVYLVSGGSGGPRLRPPSVSHDDPLRPELL